MWPLVSRAQPATECGGLACSCRTGCAIAYIALLYRISELRWIFPNRQNQQSRLTHIRGGWWSIALNGAPIWSDWQKYELASTKTPSSLPISCRDAIADKWPKRSSWQPPTDSRDEIARANGCPVDIVVGRLSEETVDQLGIHFGEAKRL
jgi:hypothetical protein